MTDTAFFAEAHALADAIEATPDLQLPPLAPDMTAQLPALIDPAAAFLPVPMSLIKEVATLLHGMPGLPKLFQDIKACEAVAYRAARWRVDPVFVAEQSYQAKVDGPIGYQAKLLNAVLLANAPFERRPRYVYGYAGDGSPTVQNRYCKVFFFMRGEVEPISVTTPTVSQIKIKNSPEWFSHTDKQLAYYAIRAGGNIHFPDVLAGAYTIEEIKIMAVQDQAPRGHKLFEEDEPPAEPIDAEFHSTQPTPEDLKRSERAEAKASGAQDSNDPRDEPANRGKGRQRPQMAQEPPPTGNMEPDDLHELRVWATSEQGRILALADHVVETEQWNVFIKDSRWGRLKAYDQPVANALKAAVLADIKSKRDAQ